MSGIQQPPMIAFMEDLTVVPGCKWILQGLVKLIFWARMSFKPKKSRSMVLKRGKIVDKFCFSVDDVLIPTINDKPVTSLGKVFDCSLTETQRQSNQPSRSSTLLLVYEVAMSTVEILESKISCHLRRLLGLPHSLTSAALYGTSNKIQLPISSLEEEEQTQQQVTLLASLLSSASNWELRVDLGRQLKFPHFVTLTFLRPDVVLTSASSKQVLLVELSVPWEDSMEKANELKQFKYQEFIEEC
ncbi:hypothetical protein Q8A73_004940 [Channa argus]|nr:hypothetical protein Q8A73_004940 [Channa argus]